MTNEQYLKNLQVPDGKVDVVLDTDAYNEIDDQYAISLMMKSPEKFNVKAIFAAPFFNGHSSSPADGMEKSYQEILNLLKLLGMEDFSSNVYRGSTSYLKDEETPVISDSAKRLVEIAKNYSPAKPLYVVAIGAITNVASALIIDPTIAENIVIVWLGGHALHWRDTREFNMYQDVAAARVVYKSASPYVQLPCCGVVSAVTTTKPELEFWLKGKNALCDYLVQHTVEEAESYAKGKPWSRVIWDVTSILWFFGGNIMNGKIIDAPMPEYDDTYSYPVGTKKMYYVTDINRDAAFEVLFTKLA
ncbi:MAG: nucleoside hydrolase [Clostridia bacterium]|nr:nucleoside hydrolase [Clostridia bacterium]